MLSTTKRGASQSPTNAGAAAPTTTATTIEETVKVQVKGEPFSNLSPENVSNQTQIMSDETGGASKIGNNNANNNNSNNNKNNSANTNTGSSISGSGLAEAGAKPGSITVAQSVCITASALRQNASNSPSNAHNGSDHSNTNSNSSNVSTNLTQIVDSDIHQEEVLKRKKGIKEEDNAKLTPTQTQATTSGNTSLEKVSQNSVVSIGNTSKIGSGVAMLATAVKEESTDLMGSLVNMKKEENFSPSMSPVGFGSIGSISGPSGNSAPDRSITPVKMELSSNSTEKPQSVLGLNSDDIVGCNTLVNTLETDRMSENVPSNSNVTVGQGGSAGSGSAGHGSGPGLGISLGMGINMPPVSHNFMGSNNVSSVLGNCLDYMQQQNHIFVFSTELANKGAESVLSGQFQTIIAYHCTQPATKSFLEDFFMKNPMKMNKLQRQNSMGLGICNITGPGVNQTWQNSNTNSNQNSTNLNPNPNLSKMLQPPQKSGGNGPKSHFNNQIDSNKRSTFADPSPADSLVSESDLMCWEASNVNPSVCQNNLVSTQSANESQAQKLLEGVDSVVSGLGKCNTDLSVDNNIISLQGVKVPDENLTPQQRQHREEQLAKLKKMNQFLFPENDSAPNQLSKLPNESAMTNIIMSMPGASNAQMRQMQLQMQTQKSQDHMAVQPGDDTLMPLPLAGDVIGEIGAVISCNSSSKSSLPCTSNAVSTSTGGSGPGAGPVAGSVPGSGVMNIMNVSMQCAGAPNTPNLMSNSPEMMGAFGNTNSGIMGVGVGPGSSDKGAVTNQEGIPMPQGGMTQIEWAKIQQQFFEERLKSGKTPCRPSGMPGPAQGIVPGAGIQQPPINVCSGGNTSSIVNPSNPALRNNVQGPPPPYHPTQRSASVPIATQSPNPSSPNNLSLPSPRTAGALVLPSNSPSMELPAANSSVSASNSSAMGAIATSKNSFQPEARSPSSRNRGGGNSANVLNHQLNSNPSTPLSHLSPKELDAFNPTLGTGELKRPSPHRPRSPANGIGNPNSGNHLIEPNNMDSRYPASSPGLNFNAHAHLQSNPNTAMNVYKGPNSNNPLELNRQNCGSGGPSIQFSRRSDNMPLNPNSSNRPAQNKMSQNFDPISSLAQMSQQLTSCVSGVGSPAGGMNMMGSGPPDINMEHGGMMPSIDAGSLDHMNHAAIGNTPTNCHPVNPLMNSMGQRMLNPKMCSLGHGFNASPNGIVRDGPGPGPGPGFHGVLPPGARMMGRMPVNFGPNFNPNIQVKASTPNTIQYMPVRPQSNSNNNSSNNGGNVRMPPSLEFLQRYANPQIASSGGGPPMGHAIGNDGGHMMIGGGPMNMNSLSEQQQQQHQSKLVNNPNGNSNGIGMTFFQNCNQLPVIDDEGSVGSAIPGHEIIGQTPMIRGMRPHGMRQHGMGSRMQTPSGNIVSRQQSQFPVTADGLDCNDPNVMFNNGAVNCNSTPGMFAASQQGQPKSHHKPMPTGMCQSQVAANVGMQGPAGQGHSGMSGPNSSNLMAAGSNGGASGGSSGVVNFVGPSSNDLKYAQQYHSFQQQLYATNTRSQQQQQQQQTGSNMIAMPPNLSPNPAFFVNK